MREIVHIQTGQCGNQIGAKVWVISDLQEFMDISVINRLIYWYLHDEWIKYERFLPASNVWLVMAMVWF